MPQNAFYRRANTVARVDTGPSVDDRLDACLEQRDRDRVEVAVRQGLGNVLYYGGATALAVYLTLNIWAIGSLVAVLVAAALLVTTGQAIISLVVGCTQAPSRLLTAKGRRGYGWFLLATSVQVAEVAFGGACLYLLGRSADWWGLLH